MGRGLWLDSVPRCPGSGHGRGERADAPMRAHVRPDRRRIGGAASAAEKRARQGGRGRAAAGLGMGLATWDAWVRRRRDDQVGRGTGLAQQPVRPRRSVVQTQAGGGAPARDGMPRRVGLADGAGTWPRGAWAAIVSFGRRSRWLPSCGCEHAAGGRPWQPQRRRGGKPGWERQGVGGGARRADAGAGGADAPGAHDGAAGVG